MNTKDIKKMIKLFANKTGCDIQYSKCPCGTCFQNMGVNYAWLSWLLILALRGDYSYKDLEDRLKECLNEKAHN